jgi:hypothetical protein
MNDPTENALREALQERGEAITPTPALPGILHRANASNSRALPRWASVAGAGVASAALVAAVLVAGPDWYGDATVATPQPPSASEAAPELVGERVMVPAGTVVPMALHFASDYAGGTLVSGEFEISSSGDIGLDAVHTLLTLEPGEPFTNWWTRLNSDPAAEPIAARSVRVSDEQITVDFNRFLGVTCPANARCYHPDAVLTLQQLVQTIQSVLRSDAPVLLTVGGEPASEAFGVPLDGPVQADRSVAPGIRVSSPQQGATLSSPVVVAGESTSNEGTVLWAAERDGKVVKEDFTTGGSMGDFAEFEVSIDLPPGDYTIRLWEENAAGDAEGLAARLSPVYLDLTVE